MNKPKNSCREEQGRDGRTNEEAGLAAAFRSFPIPCNSHQRGLLLPIDAAHIGSSSAGIEPKNGASYLLLCLEKKIHNEPLIRWTGT